MNLLIEYSKAADLICAIYKYHKCCSKDSVTNPSNTTTFDNLIDFCPSKQIKNWLKYVDAEISPFLKSDLQLLNGKILCFLNTYMDIILANDISEPGDLITVIRDMPDDGLIKTVFKYYELDIAYESDEKMIFDRISKLYDEETASVFIQVKRYPSEYKSKVLNLLEVFYKNFIQPNDEYVSSFMNEKLKQHNKKMKTDPIAFLNIIGIGDYSKAIKDSPNVRILISYYIDLGFYYANIRNIFLIFYGFYMEERFNQQVIQDKYKNLFKALSDEKRLEIIRLTSKRPWYNKELADYFDLTTATLSYHLNLLLDLGILNFEPSDNKRYYYTTNKENVKAIFEYALEDLTTST